MTSYKLAFVFIQTISLCLCEIDFQKKTKLVNGFVEFYNSLPNEIFRCDEGILLSAQQTDISNAYDLNISLKVTSIDNLDIVKYFKCSATVADVDQIGVAVMKYKCEEDVNPGENPSNIEEKVNEEPNGVTEAPFIRIPIQLDNEVQTDTAVTSGEQFIAIPREEKKIQCIGCSSHINTQAQGVSELAAIGVRQLNSLEPNIQHILNSVVDVERQVQVVNGVRYILTLLIDYNGCSTQETDPCSTSKACKITILEKPWMKLSDGSKYRAILSNNCTEEWRFGDNGVVVPPTDNKEQNNISPTNPDGSDILKAVHNVDVQSLQNTEKSLADQDLKTLEEQIIPHSQLSRGPTEPEPTLTTPLPSGMSKEHVLKVGLENEHSPNSIQTSKPQKLETLDADKKKTIDELLNFFDFAGFEFNTNHEQEATRMKRSFENDLNVLKLAEKFKKVKTNIENAKHIYSLAQTVVDYLNEGSEEKDLEVKDKVLKDVISAEEESENGNSFYYIQFRIVVPCKTSNCKAKDTVNKICNAVIDNSEKVPQVLNVFCHDEDKRNHLGKSYSISLDDPMLLKLIQESIKKIESESKNDKAMKLNKVIDASTQRVSGTLTKVSIILEQTDCDKSVPFKLRNNCSIVEEYGSLICDVTIHERHWLKERSITYTCTERPVDIKFSEVRKNVVEKSPNDPVVRDMVQEALHKLEMQSKRNNKQLLVRVNSVSTQVVAGILTYIEFIVGYTNCPSYVNTVEPSTKCRLLENEPLKTCTAKVWDRSWMEDGRQVEVFCNEPNTGNNETNRMKGSQNFEGGIAEKDVNDPKMMVLAKESLQKFLKTSGSNKHYALIQIDRATVQIVSGTKFVLHFKISPTNCQIDGDGKPTSSNCNVLNSEDTTTCWSEVWQRHSLNKKDIKVSCQTDDVNISTKRPTTGGFNIDGNIRYKRSNLVGAQDPNLPEYKQLAEESLQKHLQNTGNSQPHSVVSIQTVRVQVVSGTLTEIFFKITPTAPNTDDAINCFSSIWEKPWKNKKEFNVTCPINETKIREKRNTISTNLKGGDQEEDPTKEEFKELAKDALRKYQQKQKSAKNYVIAKVKKVTKKVTSKITYKIDFTAAPESCALDVSMCNAENPLLNCRTTLKIRPLQLQKDIDVSCKTYRTRNKRRANLKEAEYNGKLDQLTEIEFLDLDERGKRQTGIDDDYVDEDTRFYYADRAIQQLNDQLRSNNLYKLITIHTAQSSMHMDNTPMVRMYIEAAETYCLRHHEDKQLSECEELDGNNHRLCLARLWPSPDDELVIQTVSIVCDDDEKFESITGLSIPVLLKASIKSIEQSPKLKYKLVHQGEPQLIPTLDSSSPIKLNFIIRTTNCSKHVDSMNKHNCFIDGTKPSKACSSFIWLVPNSRTISKLTTSCAQTELRSRRSVPLDSANATADDLEIQKMVKESLEKLEMTTPQRYKQKVLKINSYSTKVTSGKVTTIDFDVAFTSCLKYEWVDDIETCRLLEHLPRRRCIAEIWERLWLDNGKNIEVSCEDEVAPLETHVEFGSAKTAMALANRALKHIEAKYPHPRKQKVVRIYSMDKQVVAGVHYRMKMEVGLTNCSALSGDNYCVVDDKAGGENKFCRVNVWVRPWTDHPPNFRVTCDYQEGGMADLYHQIQAEHLFRDFMATYSPEYVHDFEEMLKRFEVFKDNVRRIHELNTHERGTATYGVTRFADLTYEEFTQKHMGLKPSLKNVNQVPMTKAQIPNVEVPESYDWREHGAVTEVKDQGSCGSCWAFSVTGNIEGQWKLKSGKLVSLSEQELVDCDKMDDGCNGGLPDNAYRAIEQLGGLEAEFDYPYEGQNDKCAFNKSLSRVQITSAVNITSNETDMVKWLVQNGPISIGINANAMQFYMGGVSHPWKMLCSPSNLDHGVLIVGYGIKNYPLFHKRLPYWIVKNSWGESWGEKGYYRVFRGDGTCGVNQMASSAIV